MTIYGVCYQTKEPVIYNKGSKYERQESNFLYVQAGAWNAQSIVDELNAKLAAGETVDTRTGAKFDLTNINHFYVAESSEMY